MNTLYRKVFHGAAAGMILCVAASGCAVEVGSPSSGRSSQPSGGPSVERLDPRDAARLRPIMEPLLRAADHPRSAGNVTIGVIDDPGINAANAGGGEYLLTTGLLKKASDEELRGVLAHEIAHDDLGHVAKAQIVGTGVNLGVIFLEQIVPGSSALTPIVGTLITRGYSRSEELEADRHAVEILRRAGYSKQVLIDTLEWVGKSSSGGGGFLSTHPATEERIAALQRL